MGKVRKNRIDKPFDKAWKAGMYNMAIARDLFEEHLPVKVKRLLDLSTLDVKKNSYIDEQNKESHSDILYSIKTKTGEDGYVYILAEQQRSPKRHMVLRMCKYIIQIIEDHLKQHPGKRGKPTKYPIVVPLLCYNGKPSPYPYPMDLWSYFANPKLAKQLMLQPIHLIDVHQIPDDFSRRRFSALMNTLLKYMREERDFLKIFEQLCQSGNIVSVYEEVGETYVLSMIELALVETSIGDKARFSNVIDGVLSTEGEIKMKSLLDREYEAGMQAGVEQGVEQGAERSAKTIALNLLKNFKDSDLVAKMTGLSPDTIQALQAEIA